MAVIHKYVDKVQDFFTLSRGLDGAYLRNITSHNTFAITAAAILTIIIELSMTVRLFISHPAIDTPASQVYLVFYLSLIGVAGLYLLIQGKVSGRQTYRLQFGCTACYLLWNVLLNSYDLYRNDRGSSLALVSAIIFASILVHFRPHHMMFLQGATYALFYAINIQRIDDKINATIAVTVAIVANVLFYIRDINLVHNQQRLAQMTTHLEKEQMDGAMQYLRRLQESQSQTAIYHHDLRHTLNLVEQLAQQGNLERLKTFVSDSQENLNVTSPVFYCQHEAVNLILGSFAQRSAKNDITFDTLIRLPETLPLADTELCALLCNLLENALVSTKKVTDPTLRRIYIKAVVNGDKLVILVENGFEGQVLIEEGRPISPTPDAAHGFGVQSIIDITQRHRGLYIFEAEEQKFSAKILLQL